ncbi:membrane protein [Aquimarina pacifica]|uniref:membrane protein n=1 Tax=Aquimarina pacifica TaxID=1296415 RepID=UPI000471252B|nr:membrane protein [Aquimarina pacifica]
MKKFLVLGVLFILPLVAYLFFASGVHNFSKLPVLNDQIGDLNNFEALSDEQVMFKDKISVLGFLGNDIFNKQGNAFNLNQKIYKKNAGFRDFQFVMALPFGSEDEAKELLDELDNITDVSGWKFVFGTPERIKTLFHSLGGPHTLDENLATNYVYIIDKNGSLRGRDGKLKENEIEVYGYDASSVADLSNVMNDDIKVILAEYRLALKKYKADRTEN